MSKPTVRWTRALLAYCSAALWQRPDKMHALCTGSGIIGADDTGVVRAVCSCRCHGQHEELPPERKPGEEKNQ